MLADIENELRCLRANILEDSECAAPEPALTLLRSALLRLIAIMDTAFERLDKHEIVVFGELEKFGRYERETSVDNVQEKLKNIDVSLCKVCKDIEDLKNEAIFRSVL